MILKKVPRAGTSNRLYKQKAKAEHISYYETWVLKKIGLRSLL